MSFKIIFFLLTYFAIVNIITSTPAEFCKLQPEYGTGHSCYKIRFYYHVQTNCCLPFYYSGQAGNSNNFHSVRDCCKTCGVRKIDTPYPTGDPYNSNESVGAFGRDYLRLNLKNRTSDPFHKGIKTISCGDFQQTF